MDLREWTMIFIKQRDLIKKEIISLGDDKEGFSITKKDGSKTLATVQEKLTKESLTRNPAIIICLNSKDNVETLAREWRLFAAAQELLMVFANPKTNERWLLKPHHHDKIADSESLRQGLLAMHEAIGAA